MAKTPPERKKNGRWKPGESGNPGGRPSMPKATRLRLSNAVPAAVSELISLTKSEDESIKLRAVQTLIERVYGKAVIGAVEAIPLDHDARVAELEARAHELALGGDVRMLEMMLIAGAPERYGKDPEPADDDAPTGVVFTRGPDPKAEPDG